MPRIEIAPTGRARCQTCGLSIDSGNVRVVCRGALGGSWRGRSTKMINKYHHWECYSRGSQMNFNGFYSLPEWAQDEVRERDPATIKYNKQLARMEAASASKATVKKATKKRKAESSPVPSKKAKLVSSPSEPSKNAAGAQPKGTSKTTVKLLKAELKAAGLKTTGKKAELLARVQAHCEGRVDEGMAAKEKVKKPKVVTRRVKFPAVGMKFRGGHTFSSSDNISLQADPYNAYDPNAIKVLVGKSHIAFVSGKHCPKLHAFLPKVTRVDFLANVTGKYGSITSATLVATYAMA